MILINHDYHIVELNCGYNTESFAKVFEWLMLKFGPGDGTRWMYRHPKLYFADPKDHMMFVLRWS